MYGPTRHLVLKSEFINTNLFLTNIFGIMVGMGCNNENWSPHPENHASSKPVKETPEDMKGFNMTELAQWVNGDINQIVKKVPS